MKRRLVGLGLCVGGVAGAAGLRRALRAPSIPDPTGPGVVEASDGVLLHTEVDDGSAPTVVLVHGFTARMQEWQLQREHLCGRQRVVLYDQRGHGRSGWGSPLHATIDQLADDLARVLSACAPERPVVLVGHSMGGMAIMALARTRPELFGTQVTGVFLLATSAGEVLNGRRLGPIVRTGRRLHLLELWLRLVQVAAPAAQHLRRPGTRQGYAFTRHYLFGSDDATPELVREVQALLELTPLSIGSAFYPLFTTLDEQGAFAALSQVPVTVLVGDTDRLTPRDHSERIAEGIGASAELVVVPGAGHSVNVSRPEVVHAALDALIARATPWGDPNPAHRH